MLNASCFVTDYVGSLRPLHTQERNENLWVYDLASTFVLYTTAEFFFFERGQMLRLCFGSSVRKEKQMWWEPKSSLSTSHIHSPIKIPCSITCIHWHVDLKGCGTHISVSSTFTNCIHSLTGTITLTYTLRFEKELLEIDMDKRIFFLLVRRVYAATHRERTCDGVSDDLSTLSNSPYTPKAYKSRYSGLGKKRKKAESMASNNDGQESP